MQASASASFTTFTVFSYTGAARWWALKQMGILPPKLHKVKGLIFYKLMGSGKGPAFSITPDFSRYMLLAVWNSQEEAKLFFNTSSLMNEAKSKADEVWTIKMIPVQAHGQWAGCTPFECKDLVMASQMPVAVLTRASLKWRHLMNFFSYAQKTSKAVAQAKGLIFSCGIGERPFTRQATFSIWENLEAMKGFAYGTQAHRSAMQQQNKQGWYREELFARFCILGTEGSYGGEDPFRKYLFPNDPLEEEVQILGFQ